MTAKPSMNIHFEHVDGTDACSHSFRAEQSRILYSGFTTLWALNLSLNNLDSSVPLYTQKRESQSIEQSRMHITQDRKYRKESSADTVIV
jgi:hypothetical protein